MAKPTRYTDKDIQAYFTLGQWDKVTTSHIWDKNVSLYPDKQAIEDLTRAFTWAEAKVYTDKLAVGLIDLGIKRDEVFVVQLPNCNELNLMRVACEKAGIICLPVLSDYREREIRYILNYTSAAAIVTPTEFKGFNYLEMIRKIRPQSSKLRHTLINSNLPVNDALTLASLTSGISVTREHYDLLEKRRYRAEEVSIVFLTSGTTGFPKFVEYPAAACAKAGHHFAKHWSITTKDVIAAIAPASRGPNVTAYQAAPYVAAKTVMIPWSTGKDALKLFEQRQVTIACLVPTQLAKILQDYETGSYDLRSLRLWISAGSILSPALAEEVEKKMGGVIVDQYGAVDFGIMTITVPEDEFAARMYTVGKPRFDDAVKILDDQGKEVSKGEVGEIMGKGPCCSSGYYRDLNATNEAWDSQGWYATGDLGRIDDKGNIVLVGRKKEMIIRGGQNIIPSEVENLILSHPKVQDAAVVAMPDDIMGEKACAYVVTKNSQTISFEEVVSFLKQQGIAPYKLPERIEVLDRLPTTEGQKIDKKALVLDITQKIESERNQ